MAMINGKHALAEAPSNLAPEREGRQVSTRLQAVLRKGGIYYSCLYTMRWLVRQMLERIDYRLVRIEQRKGLLEPWAISAGRFTAEENKRLWNEHDWSSLGEEWTQSAEWKERVIREILIPYVPEGATVLEIGPGGGRWTDLLQRRARRLVVLDISEKAIALCRQRFASCSHIEYLVGSGRTIAVPDHSIDVIWSFDVFVHINPPDARSYFQEFRRILKPGGHALIHHPGAPLPGYRRRPGWRSDLTDTMVQDFIREAGLRLVSQSPSELVKKGDALTIFESPVVAGLESTTFSQACAAPAQE